MSTTIHDLRKLASDLEADGGDPEGTYIGLLYKAARELECAGSWRREKPLMLISKVRITLLPKSHATRQTR